MNIFKAAFAEKTAVPIVSIVLFLALFSIVPSTVTADPGPTDWMIVTVDGEGSAGSHSSIAIDSKDNVYISYRDDTNGHLELAFNGPGIWVDMGPVDSSVNIGDTSIALDSNNKAHISYHDATNTALKYATLSDFTWSCQIIDNEGAVGYSSSIAIDSQDNVHICYYDGTYQDIKYATNSGGSWSNQTLYSSGDVGSDLSMAIDSNDKLHITYYYQVTAISSIGEGTSSNIVNAKPEELIVPTVPTAPQDPQGFSGDGYVLLTWSAPSDDGGSDITAYNIYRGTEPDNLTQLTSVSSTQTSYNDTSVENGQTHYYRITAVNDVGDGALSIMVSDAPGTKDGQGSDPTMIFLIIGVIVVVAIIAVLMFILRRG